MLPPSPCCRLTDSLVPPLPMQEALAQPTSRVCKPLQPASCSLKAANLRGRYRVSQSITHFRLSRFSPFWFSLSFCRCEPCP